MRLDVADLPCGDSDYVTELHIVVDPGGKRVEGRGSSGRRRVDEISVGRLYLRHTVKQIITRLKIILYASRMARKPMRCAPG